MGIDIIGVNDGGRPADTIMIGLRGLVGQLFREDGAKKVRRGMVGLVNAGKHTGGRAYGYASSPIERGKPQIVATEAVTVKRIFDEYLSGKSPREIAHGLNEDGIAPPRGKAWNASTINGSPQRGNGIIQNKQYAGVLVWNKVRMYKNPVTGKRVSRPNPPSTWIRHDIPHLAIVDTETFDAANALKTERSKHRIETTLKRKRLLSHLLKCGCCGGGLSTAGVDKSGRVRVRCSTHSESGTCPNPKTYYLPWIENTVLTAIGKELKDRSIVDAAYTNYRNDHLNQIETNNQRRLEILTRLDEIPIEISRLTDCLAKGIGDPFDIDQRCHGNRVEEEMLNTELQTLDDLEDNFILRHAAFSHYRNVIKSIRKQAKTEQIYADNSATNDLRSLIKSVTIIPNDEDDYVTANVHIKCRLRPLSQLPVLSGGLMVAKEGLEPPTYGL